MSKVILRQLQRIFLSALVLTCLTFASCGKKEVAVNPADSPVSATVPRPVQLLTLPDGNLAETRTFPVFVKGGETAKLSFRVPGRIVELNCDVGTRFNKGDVVAALDPRDYELAVARSERSIEEAQAGLSAMETGARSEDVSSLEAALEAAKSQLETAKRQFERMESLKKDGAVSEVQYDLAKSTYDSAVAVERSAEMNLEKAQKGSRDEEIEMTKAKIAGLMLDRDLAKNKLEDTKLLAPFTGVVSEKFFENHETVLPGVAILTLVDDCSFEGELSVSEELVARQGDVQSIECTFETLPDKVFPASVRQTSSSVQKGNRSYLATISIDAKPEDGLLIGMVGTAKMTLKDSRDFYLVPSSALVPLSDGSDDGDSSVWIFDSATNSISRRNVKVGVFINDQAQILSGLKGGETIVSAGARFLTDGQEVRPVSE
ncbi:MAG: efflux RND transporter periplasmic adaptor subunit [Thermoguttaceae bacterium]|nr:efflux RND transporter periplasmic adaptor subunit [Thermoguttaceae bacterium]MBQ2556215.1 efflux RND transporter periplasmic adaptor subunit [Thermoguttaceae bacterium]MBQ5367537.1 efflux RND transporter periplasmic adaptor subunit [Thermoguttaceae bacterium]